MRRGFRYSWANTMWARGAVLCAAVLLALPAMAQKSAMAANSKSVVVLHGNVPSFVSSQTDYGFADPALAMNRIILTLKIAPAKKAELNELLKEQQDPSSSHYHCWLTPEQFGKRFGPTKEQLRIVERWLKSQGFSIDSVAKGRLWINFSGNVSQVEQAFHTRIHNYMVNGRTYDANATDPAIPANLAPIVAGVVSLNNYPLKPMHTGIHRLPTSGIQPDYTSGTTHYMSPGDFAIIYNVYSLYNAGITGSGVTIAIVGRTHPASSDWTSFRSSMGLPGNPPNVIINGTDPGDLGANEDGEADLDVEWSGAVAKDATIDFVVSKSTSTTDGVDLSAQYIVDNKLAPVMSTSFGQCESSMGTNENNFYDNLWSQASAEGITSFVSAGDSGASGCDGGSSTTGSGRAVSGLASTPYNVCVGGNEFDENGGTYWNTSNNSYYTSALSYIPEMAWNESGSATNCPSGDTCQDLWATGGGTSIEYSKPAWQVSPGVTNDGMRDCPDVSLTAAGGHDGYIVETQGSLAVIGGTSASSPSFAGIMALVVQKMGGAWQGNANPRFYQLGNEQYTYGTPVVFHDVTSGNNTVPGVTGFDCGTGYDEATGLGSVDAYALANNWAACTTPGTPTGLTATVPGDNKIDLNWSAGSPAGNTYSVYRTTGSCPGSGYSLLASGLTSLSYSDMTVSGGTTYSYEVTAVDSTGGCESAVSSCDSATATGTCTAPPSFAGLSSVTNPGNATCELDLAWSAATPNCGTSVFYDVYRATSSSFVPSSANMVATGIVDTTYDDTNALSDGSTYYYIVRAVDGSTGVEDANSVVQAGAPTGPITSSTWLDDVEGTPEFTGTGLWHVANNSSCVSPGYESPTHAYYYGQDSTCNYNTGATNNGTLTSVSISGVSASSQLSFYSYLTTEQYGNGYDNALVQISSNGGSSWTTLDQDASNGGTINDGGSGWSQYSYSLSAYAGSNLSIRFSFNTGDQYNNAFLGWFLDDIQVTNLSIGGTCATAGSVKPVPDGKWVSGTAMQATKDASDGSTVDLTWDVGTCQDANYNLYYGNGSDVSTYALQGSDCGLGNSGTASGVTLPAVPSGQTFIWWVIAGTDGVQTESSWGKDSAGNERHPAASGQCGFTAKSPASTCP